MKRFCFTSLIILYAAGLLAADSSRIGRFLSSAGVDSIVLAQQKHAPLVRDNSFSMPFIDDAEIRLRKGDYFVFDEDRSAVDEIFGLRYSLRLEPRGIGETKSIRNYHRAQVNFEEDRNGYLFNDLLMQRYITVINVIERMTIEKAYRDLITLYEDRIKVMDQLKASTDFDLNDLIKAEKDLSKLTVEQLEEAQELSILFQSIGDKIGEPSFSGFDTAGLVTVTQVKAGIDSNSFVLDENNLTLRYLKRQFELAERRFELEKAQNRSLISFLEFSYDHPSMLDEIDKKDRRRQHHSLNAFLFEVGIKLPFFSIDRQDIARRQLSFLRDMEEYEQLRRELEAKMKKDASDIRALIKQYEFLTARETEVDAEASLKKYVQMSGVDPLVLLSIKENLIKNNMEKAEVYFSILRNYIYVLEATGKMSERPLRNYLSARQEVCE